MVWGNAAKAGGRKGMLRSVTTPAEERAWWDAKASDPAVLRKSIWGESPYESNLTECTTAITEGLHAILSAPSSRVLELGCGIGRLLIPIARRYPHTEFLGTDISSAILDVARTQRDWHRAWNISLVPCDGRTLPDIAGSLDAVFSLVTFQHIPPDGVRSYITSVASHLHPGGRFRFQFVAGNTENPYDVALDPTLVTGWLDAAGLSLLNLERGRMYESWTWMLAEKR